MQDGSAVFLEYAWDMAWCGPCAADPLTPEELRELGVFRIDASTQSGGARDAFVTPLHVRYDEAHFPEDLAFQETGDRSNFQGRYVLRKPYEGELSCSGADAYRERLSRRRDTEARAGPGGARPSRPGWAKTYTSNGPACTRVSDVTATSRCSAISRRFRTPWPPPANMIDGRAPERRRECSTIPTPC